MKTILLCCITFLFCGSAYSATSGEFINKNVDMIKEFVDERPQFMRLKSAVLSICPGYGEKFEQAYIKMRNCVYAVNLDEETMCSYVKNHVEQCTRPIISMLEECLPEKSRDSPAFAIKSLISMTNYICKINGEHLIELHNPCIFTESYKMNRCLLKTRSKLQQYASVAPSKAEICEFFKSMRFCMKSHLESSCRHPITREAMMGLFDSGLNVCDAESTSINEIDSF